MRVLQPPHPQCCASEPCFWGWEQLLSHWFPIPKGSAGTEPQLCPQFVPSARTAALGPVRSCWGGFLRPTNTPLGLHIMGWNREEGGNLPTAQLRDCLGAGGNWTCGAGAAPAQTSGECFVALDYLQGFFLIKSTKKMKIKYVNIL